jgi:hypothetical protein
MADDDIEILRKVRAKLVEQRRARMRRDASKPPAEISADNLIALQAAIEAVDRAIIDEEKILGRAPALVP